jgi:hypothetical protein
MALRTPPSWLQQGSHPAENDRLTSQAIFRQSGIIGNASLAVTAQLSPNMTVNVAEGQAAVLNNVSASAGVYICTNDATTVLTIQPSNPSLPRIDRIVLQVNDAYYSGLLNNVTFTVLAGTPNASPAAPATPSNAISLATVAVAALATTITNANITDTRFATSSNWQIWTSATRPVTPSTGTFGYNLTNLVLESYNGSAWVPAGLGYWSTAGRPATPLNGEAGYNTDLLSLEYWNGTAWTAPSGTDFSPSLMLMGG